MSERPLAESDLQANRFRDAVSHRADNAHSNSSPESPKQPSKLAFVTTAAHKAARTRAWRTSEGFSHAQVQRVWPASVFVRFRLLSEKLKGSGIPVVRTRYEDALTSGAISSTMVLGPKDIPSHTQAVNPDRNTLCESHSVNNQESKVKNGLNFSELNEALFSQANNKDSAENSGEMTNHGRGPSITGHTNQPPGISELASPNPAQSHYSPSGPFHLPFHPSPTQPSKKHSRSYQDPILATGKRNRVYETTEDQNVSASNTLEGLDHSAFDPPIESDSQISDLNPSTRLACSKKREGSGKPIVGALTEDLTKGTLFDPALCTVTHPNHHSLQPSDLKIGEADEQDSIQIPVINSHNSSQRTTRSKSNLQQPKHLNWHTQAENMAPVRDPNNVDTALKDSIQKLYEVQSQVHGFVPETQPLLVEKMAEVADSLFRLQTLTSETLSPNNPIHKARVAPEVIDYVDDSRNPDIYNREFVELVQRGNAVMNGKQKAFREFSETLAAKIKERLPELSNDVDKIVKNNGWDDISSKIEKTGSLGANGANKTEQENGSQKESETGNNGTKSA